MKSSIQKIEIENLPFLGALVYAFLFSFYPLAATLAMVLWIILTLISFSKKRVYNNFILLLPVVLFVSYLFSMVLTSFSVDILQRKLSLIIFPIIFFFNRFTIKQKQKVYLAVVYGLLFTSITCLFIATYKSIHFESGKLIFSANVLEGRGFMESIVFGGNYFFGRFYSFFHQTVYFSLYLCAGISILLFHKINIPKIIRIGLVVYFAFVIFLISNKAGFLVLTIILFLKLMSLKLKPFKKLLMLISLCLVIVFLGYNSPRIKASFKKLETQQLLIDKNARYDYKTRLLSWDTAIRLIKRSPIIGYGPNETQNKLNEVYSNREYKYPLKYNYNAHNQFFQIWLENGLLGLIGFILLFIFLLQRCIKKPKERMFFIASFIFLFVNAFFESYFNRFSGISFFTFWWCIIISDFDETKD